MSGENDFERLVKDYYEALYRFAFTLTRNEPDAADLTQQTFYIWAAKGEQLREPSKVRSWLFTTLYRDFLGAHRRVVRFPQQNLEDSEAELPEVTDPVGLPHDTARVLQALGTLEETFRAPVALFYLGDYAYKDIAEILGVPLGTVKSRLSRGIERLQGLLADPDRARRSAIHKGNL